MHKYEIYLVHYKCQTVSTRSMLAHISTVIGSFSVVYKHKSCLNVVHYIPIQTGDNNSSVVLRAWMDEIGGFIKKLAPNHLISSGIEGHGQQYGYGGNEGNNFIVIHESPYIDFCSAHLYPEEYWANLNMSSSKTLIERWINDCQNIVGKQFFLGEFNVQKNDNNNTRSDWWTMIYDTIESNDGGGDAFWWFEYTNVDGEYGVMDNATELQVFLKHSQNMQKKSG